MPLVLSLPTPLFLHSFIYCAVNHLSLFLSPSLSDPISPSVPRLSLVTLHRLASTGHTHLPRVKGNGDLLATFVPSIDSFTWVSVLYCSSLPLVKHLITSHSPLFLSLHQVFQMRCAFTSTLAEHTVSSSSILGTCPFQLNQPLSSNHGW